jgi:hypothetical protein
MSEVRGIELGFTDERLHGSCHCCLIYDDEEQRRHIVPDFLAAGIAHRELVRYLTDGTPPEAIRGSLAARGVDVPAAEARGCFGVAEAQPAYCPSGRFEPEEMIETNKQRYVSAERAGFTATRICCEMTWALRDVAGAERLLEYEALLNTVDVAFRHFGMCQYDARRFDGATLYKVLQVHPYMVAHGQIVQNPYYVRPEEILPALRRGPA